MIADVQAELKRKMDHTITVFNEELAAVRTGRASADILKPVMVEYYGTLTPLHQLANIATPDAQLITVSPYDPSSAKNIEKSIKTMKSRFFQARLDRLVSCVSSIPLIRRSPGTCGRAGSRSGS